MRIGIRIIFGCICGILLLFCIAIPCAAETAEDSLDTLYDIAADMEIPDAAAQQLADAGITADDPSSVAELSPSGFMKSLAKTVAAEAAAPVKLCGMLLSLTVLSTLLGSLNESAADASMRRLLDTLCTLICIGSAAEPLCTCLIRTAQALDEGRVFMASFVPVFGAFLAAGGSIAGSATYQVFVLFLTEGMMQLTNGLLFPLLQMAAALGIVDAVNPGLGLKNFVSGFRTAVTWTLGFVMTMFSALLSIRSFVSSAADSLASKSVKLLTSSMIPIVGSAVSEAYGTVQGSIHLLRNGVGAVGMLVIVWLVLPPLISLMLYRIVFRVMNMFADMAGAKQMAQLYQNTQAVLSAAFAMLICFAVMLIFSSAILLLLLGGGE